MLKAVLKKLGLSIRSQNLDERPGDDYQASGSKLMHGRAWINRLRDGEEDWNSPTLRLSWNLRSSFCHLQVEVDGGENEVSWSAALPPIALWVSVDRVPQRLFQILGVDFASRKAHDHVYERAVSLSVHDWAIWWNLWMATMQSNSTDPKWRRGCFHIVDAIFGTRDRVAVPISTEAVVVPMPEKLYTAKVETVRATWTRSRWPFTFGPKDLYYESLSSTITPDVPIPVPGKGENSWDCDDDAIYSHSSAGGPVEAIASLTESVHRTRRRHGGRNWLPPQAAPVVEA